MTAHFSKKRAGPSYHAGVIKIVVSACLLGAPVRPDGTHRQSTHPVLQRWLDEGRVVSVCPEVLGGLGTPRPPAEMAGGRVVTRDGDDVTAAFTAGAAAAAELARGIRVAVLKEGSPSCGSSLIYDGTFSGAKIPGQGVTTAMLRAQGITVFSEKELEAADAYVARLEG
jgi:uncharacterized protein YbbK (DUF523 family)